MKSRVLNSLILLTLSVTLVSCNEAAQFSNKVSTAGSISISNPDSDSESFCNEAKDLDECLAQKDLCQPAFKDVLDGQDKPYIGCIANPGNIGENTPEDEIKAPEAPVVVAEEPVKEPAKAPEAPVVVAEEPAKEPVKAPEAPVKEPVKAPEAPVKEPVKAPEAPVNEPVKAPEAPVVVAEEEAEEVASLENAGDCSKLDEKYIFSKEKGQIKVKVCHSCSTGSHAIIVACPALKAHVKHQKGQDYLGACKDE
jgi:hypothetical protein